MLFFPTLSPRLSFCPLSVCPPSFSQPLQLQHEKAELEQHLEQEQEFQVNKLMKKIKKMENETISKQLTLEQVRSILLDCCKMPKKKEKRNTIYFIFPCKP